MATPAPSQAAPASEAAAGSSRRSAAINAATRSAAASAVSRLRGSLATSQAASHASRASAAISSSSAANGSRARSRAGAPSMSAAGSDRDHESYDDYAAGSEGPGPTPDRTDFRAAEKSSLAASSPPLSPHSQAYQGWDGLGAPPLSIQTRQSRVASLSSFASAASLARRQAEIVRAENVRLKVPPTVRAAGRAQPQLRPHLHVEL
mmetsp:Transcript_11186/g.35710  ORF Transcript_11186/g.35710 Transcript_11186/m.35710 type:complete len:206 (-) Transcript_11186:103-720(-)